MATIPSEHEDTIRMACLAAAQALGAREAIYARGTTSDLNTESVAQAKADQDALVAAMVAVFGPHWERPVRELIVSGRDSENGSAP